MHDDIWTPGADENDGPVFTYTVVPDGKNVSLERIKLLADEAWALQARDRERAARVVAWHTLPRGFKWSVDHPRILKVLKRLRVWNPPPMQWSPPHPNCRTTILPFID